MGFDMSGLGTTMALAKQVEEQKGRELMAQQRQQQEADQAKIFHQALLNSMVDINQPNMPQSYAEIAQTMGMTDPQAQQLYDALRNQAIGNLQAKQMQAQASGIRAQTGQENLNYEYQRLANQRADQLWDNYAQAFKKANMKIQGVKMTDNKGMLTEEGMNYIKNQVVSDLKKEAQSQGKNPAYATFLSEAVPTQYQIPKQSTGGFNPVESLWPKQTQVTPQPQGTTNPTTTTKTKSLDSIYKSTQGK